jgi:hypothetical protein
LDVFIDFDLTILNLTNAHILAVSVILGYVIISVIMSINVCLRHGWQQKLSLRLSFAGGDKVEGSIVI